MWFIVRLLINAGALWVATEIVPGVSYTGGWLPLLAVAPSQRAGAPIAPRQLAGAPTAPTGRAGSPTAPVQRT